MNKKQKGSILISAIASIAFAGSVLAGGTYALFTSESKTNIAVTSGTVNVEATASDLWVYSPTSISTDAGNAIIDANNAASVITEGVSGRFYNGGTATLNASEGVVTLDKMTPGDKATFKITITNKSNVKTKYRTVIKKVDPTDNVLFEALDFNIGGLIPEVATVWQNLKAPETEGGEVVTTYNCKVELPTTISGSEYMDKKCTIQILVEAIQGNAYTSDDNGTTIASKDIDASTNSTIMDGDTKDNSTIIAEVPTGSTDATKLTLVKEPTDVPGDIRVETGNSAISTDVKLIDQDGNTVVAKGEKFFTITIDVGKNLDVINFYHKAVKLTSVKSLELLTSVNLYYYDSSTGKVTFTTTDFSVFTLEVKFAGGLGTKDAPYLIENAEHFKAIMGEYSCGHFNYYKVADSVETLDLSNVGSVRLYGEFDGNNKKITINQCLFKAVGIGEDSSQTASVIKNVDLTFDHSGDALVFNVLSNQINFENVKIHGILEGNWNMGAFVSYGSKNLTDNGFDYILNFKNCYCDATIISKQNGGPAVLIGHTYSGSGTATINVDSATKAGISNAKGVATDDKLYLYYGVGSATVYLDESLTTNDFLKGTKIGSVAPKKGDNAYVLEVQENIKTVKVQLTAQLSAYDEENNSIDSLVGITFTLGTLTFSNLTSGTSIDIFDLFDDVVIKNELMSNDKPTYSIDSDGTNKKLTVYTNTSDKYITGWLSATASQYDENGVFLCSGTLRIAHTSGTPAGENVSWSII